MKPTWQRANVIFFLKKKIKLEEVCNLLLLGSNLEKNYGIKTSQSHLAGNEV